MPDSPVLYHRKSIRLPGYDYSKPGAYFVTLVIHQRSCLFGEISADLVQLNQIGQCAAALLQSLPQHFPLRLDDWIIMPNHIHAILFIEDNENESRLGEIVRPVTSHPLGTVPRSLGAIVQNFKSITARRINVLRGTPGAPVWQRNYYEHAIRSEKDLDGIRLYITDNPKNWMKDDNRP